MTQALARNPLFDGLDAPSLDAIEASMRRREFQPREVLCRAGETGDNLLLIVSGLARVVLPDSQSETGRTVAKLRRGDLVGEMSLVTNEPRTATVVAALPTAALELDRDDFAAILARHPQILANLNRILSAKLAETTIRVGDGGRRGEAVALVVGKELNGAAVDDVLAATRAASPRSVTATDARSSFAAAVESLDALLAEHGTALVIAEAEEELLPLLVDAVDRTVALVRDEQQAEQLAARLGEEVEGQRLETIVVEDALPAENAAWIGRHLARTKIGLALGAGGAKGYAHIGALQVLEDAGYTVDCAAGSSIGALVGTWIALGLEAGAIEPAMRHAFRPEIVDQIFKLSLTGASTGLEAMTAMLREASEDKTFDDLELPLGVMTVDLDSREPATIERGFLWQALLAATALAGIFPPYEHEGRRLVDGLALVPVPTDATRRLGADIVVSINIISREVLPAWPGDVPQPETPKSARSRMLDTLLEVMDLAQLDSSERHAARADVTITPKFGPSTWRDFQLADLFLEAGRVAAQEQLPALQALANPQPSRLPI